MHETYSKQLYLIRHGETEPNRNQIIQGSGLDAPLNDFGFEQARIFFQYYQHIDFKVIYTSALQRTVQSVQLFLDKGVIHKVLPQLNEISWGVKDGTRINPAEQNDYDSMLNRWKAGYLDEKFPLGESPNEVAVRLREAITVIENLSNTPEILVCMHGRAMRIFLCLLLKIPLSEMEQFLHSNLCLYILEWDGAVWRIVVSNDVSHLK